MSNGHIPPEGTSIVVPLGQIRGNLPPGLPEVLFLNDGIWRTQEAQNDAGLEVGVDTPTGSIAERFSNNTVRLRVWTREQKQRFYAGGGGTVPPMEA